MPIKEKIFIFGCGGQARSVIQTLQQKNEIGEIILIDPNCLDGEKIMGCGTVKSLDEIKDQKRDGEYFVGIGDNSKRAYIFENEIPNEGHILTVISPFAVIGKKIDIGKGTIIGANAYIGPEVVVGCNTIINTGSIVEHETIIGNHTHVAPGSVICGKCRIGNFVMIGAGSTVIDKIYIADYVLVGAGSTVISDLLEPGIYVGSPARKLYKDNNH